MKPIPQVVWQPDTITTDPARLFRFALLWGFDGLELRTIGTATDRVPDIREPGLARRLAETGLAAVASDPGLFEGPAHDRAGCLNDLEILKDVVAFNARIGIARTILGSFETGSPSESRVSDAGPSAGSSSSVLESCQRALDIARIRNQSLLVRSSSLERSASIVKKIDHPALTAVWEPRQGDDLDPDLAPHVGMVRFVLEITHLDLERGLGEVSAFWESVLAPLAEADFTGPVCLELLTDRAGPVGLAVSTLLIRTVQSVFSGQR